MTASAGEATSVQDDAAQPAPQLARGVVVIGEDARGAFTVTAVELVGRQAVAPRWMLVELLRTRFSEIQIESGKGVIIGEDDGGATAARGLVTLGDLDQWLKDRLPAPAVIAQASPFLLVGAGDRDRSRCGGFAPRFTHGDEAVLKVQAWLEARGARVVTIDEMARQAGLAERTFLRRFKAATGLRPTEYARRIRIEMARELLRSTRRTVDQIAWSVGYEDSTAFRRVFGRIVGLSPRDYRRRFGLCARSDAATTV